MSDTIVRCYESDKSSPKVWDTKWNKKNIWNHHPGSQWFLCLSLSFNGSQKTTNSSEHLSRSPSATFRGLGSGATPVLPSSGLHQKNTHDGETNLWKVFDESMNYPLNKMTNDKWQMKCFSEVECFMTMELIFAWTVWLRVRVFWFDTRMSVAMVVYQTFHHTQIVGTWKINQWLID